VNGLLYPNTHGPAGTATPFLDRSPAALAQAGFEELAAEIERRFVGPLSTLFPSFDDWAERFLEGNDPLLEPYPIGLGFTSEDLDLSYIDLGYVDPSFAFYWLFNADWAIEPEQRRPYWVHITEAFGFPAAPIPVKTLGLAADGRPIRFDAEAFQAWLVQAGLEDFNILLAVARGESGSPFVDYRPFEDGMRPWELAFTPENVLLLRKLYLEGQEVMAGYERALERMQETPRIFSQLVELIEQSHR